jgi:hypothetical protein
LLKKLNLIVNNHDGVALMAPFVQDSLVSFTNFHPETKSFEMHMNRFAHEHSHVAPVRINSYLAIPTALAVHHNGLDKKVEDLNLLTMRSQEDDNHHYLYLIFSANKTIRITMSEMMFRMWDFGDHWDASVPKHELN